jgi:O-antigen/teichoic acid export membrane protein
LLKEKTCPAAADYMTSGGVSIFKQKIDGASALISKNSQVIRSVIALFSSNLSSALFTALGGLLVARFIGPEVNGSFRAFTIPLTYLIFMHFGTWDGLWRQIPYYVGKGIPEKVDEISSAAGAFNILVSVVVSGVFICCAAFSLIHHDLHGVFGWLSQAFFSWGVFYGGYLTSTYRTLNHFVTLARIQMAQTVLTFGMVLLLPFLGFYGLCARVAIPSFLAVWLYHRKRPLKIRYRLDTKALWDVIKIGFPFSFWGNLYTSVWTATEGALVLSLGGVSALGLFAVASVMGGAVNSLPMVIWQVLTPRTVTNLAREGSVRNANKRIIWITVGLTSFMILLAFAGSLLLDILVPYFIPKYVAGIPVMKVCLWFPVVQAAFLPINILFATGRPWLFGRSVIAGMVVFPLMTYLLLPLLGGLLAVTLGSLFGRAARTLAAYVDLIVLTRHEARC